MDSAHSINGFTELSERGSQQVTVPLVRLCRKRRFDRTNMIIKNSAGAREVNRRQETSLSDGVLGSFNQRRDVLSADCTDAQSPPDRHRYCQNEQDYSARGLYEPPLVHLLLFIQESKCVVVPDHQKSHHSNAEAKETDKKGQRPARPLLSRRRDRRFLRVKPDGRDRKFLCHNTTNDTTKTATATKRNPSARTRNPPEIGTDKTRFINWTCRTTMAAKTTNNKSSVQRKNLTMASRLVVNKLSMVIAPSPRALPVPPAQRVRKGSSRRGRGSEYR